MTYPGRRCYRPPDHRCRPRRSPSTSPPHWRWTTLALVFVPASHRGGNGTGVTGVSSLAPSPPTIATISRIDFLHDVSDAAAAAAAAASSPLWSTAATGTPPSPTITTTTSIDDRTCRNGGLVAEMPVPGAYSSLCMGLQERAVPLVRYRERLNSGRGSGRGEGRHRGRGRGPSSSDAASTVVVQQQPGGSGQTGMSVWNSGLLLTRLLDGFVDETEDHQERPDGASFWKRQEVLELGCGTGLVSIAAHKLGVRSVMATDGNPQVVRLARENIRRNNEMDHDGGNHYNREHSREETVIAAEPLQWGLLNAMDYSESASLVLGADLTYNSGSWKVLAETMSVVLKADGHVVYLSLGHDGFNVDAEVDGFLSVAGSVGLVSVSELEGINLSNLLQRLLSDAEKHIVATSGGARVLVLRRKQDSFPTRGASAWTTAK